MSKRTFYLISFVLLVCLVGNAGATTFYCDPVSGSMSNDGSQQYPWSTLQAVFENNKIETKDKSGNPKNQGAPVKAGDTIMLLAGYHGDIYQSVYFNDDYITIEAAAGAKAKLKRFRLSGGKKWIIRGLDISPSHAVTFERVTIVEFYSRNTTDGTCSDMTIEDCNVYTIADSSGWSANDWDTKACNGITLGMEGGTGLIARNNYLLNVNHGFNLEATNALAEDNTVENFSGDGIRAVYHDVAAKYNLIKNCYNVNDNHDDGIQSFLVNVGAGAVYRVNLIGNIIIDTSDPEQPLQGELQGIGIFDGPFYDFVVENNLVLTNHWHGITLLNSQNAKIVNNTVFNKWYYDYASDMYTWIEITAGSTSGGNLVRNNIAHTFDTAGDGNATVDNNLTFSRTTDDPSIWFVDYSNFDMHTVDGNSPQVDAGSGSEAPSTDIEGNSRPSGDGYDIGCYEYVVGGNISPVADAGPDQTVVDSDENGSETVSLDGSGSYDPDGTIESYVWKEDGSQIATGSNPNVVFDVNYHEVTLEVTDNDSATDTDTVIIIVNTPTAVTSTSSWQNFSIDNQTGSFTFEYDTRPNNDNMDGVTGLSQGDAAAYSDLACIVRFNTSGNMDVVNGGSYGADTTLPYSAGTNYHVRMEIDISSHTYDVYVTPEGQSEVTLADDYAFRTEQGSVTSLDRWVIIRESGSHMVDNVTVGGSSAVVMYVNDITMGYKKAGKNYAGKAIVWIKDEDTYNVEDATVYGNWSGAVSEPDQGITGFDGKVTLQSSNVSGGGTFIFTVTNVTKDGYTYDPNQNVETWDSITVP